MKLRLAGLAALMLLSACAVRKEYETPVVVPVIGSGTGGGSNQNGNPDKPLPTSTKYCAPNAKDGQHPGQYAKDNLVVTTGLNSDGSAWADGGGCVLRPIRQIWAVFNNYDVLKIDGADRYSIGQPNVKLNPTITNFYELTYYKGTPIGSIDWTIQWFEGPAAGTFDAPTVVDIIYERVRGTFFIPVWDGKIELTKLGDNVTSFYIHNHFKSAQSEDDNIGSARDVLEEMLGKARNSPPNWDNLDQHINKY